MAENIWKNSLKNVESDNNKILYETILDFFYSETVPTFWISLVHTAEPLVPEPSASEVELAIDKLESHKSPGIGQIQAGLIKAGGRTICLEIHKLITSIWKKEKLPEEWKESIIVPIHKNGDKTDCNNYRDISLLPTNYKFYPTSCSQG